MAIREDIVSSAVSFLHDPNVASSPLENKLSFLRAKNLTQEEIDAAFARTGASPPSIATSPGPSQYASGPTEQQPYYNQYPTQPYGWQPSRPEPPRRDWRDWFIMATVVGGVSYGLYSITKRYIYPLVSPPTLEKLQQDKMAVDEQFDKAFATIEQLVRDTESLKASEQERTEKLDKVIEELEIFMRDTKSASRRQDDETERLRDDMKTLKGVIPKSMTSHKDFTDGRLREITNEVKSLKSLISQRMNSAPASSSSVGSAGSTTNTGNHLKPTSGNAVPSSSTPSSTPGPEATAKENAENKPVTRDESNAGRQDYMSSLGGRSSPFANGLPGAKASIPAWQMAATAGASGSQQNSGSSP